LEQYLAMSTEFNFLVMDANQRVEAQQRIVRELLTRRVDLSQFKRREVQSNGRNGQLAPTKVFES
jgi:hypothetical protein